MKFYYENNMGDYGIFSEKDIVKAIYTAWNIEADLYLINKDIKNPKIKDFNSKDFKIIFAPYEDNDVNSELLKELGYYMADGKGYRDIFDIKTNENKRVEWSEVKQLI